MCCDELNFNVVKMTFGEKYAEGLKMSTEN